MLSPRLAFSTQLRSRIDWLVRLAVPAVWAPVLCGVQSVFLVSEERLGGSIFSTVYGQTREQSGMMQLDYRLLAVGVFS